MNLADKTYDITTHHHPPRLSYLIKIFENLEFERNLHPPTWLLFRLKLCDDIMSEVENQLINSSQSTILALRSEPSSYRAEIS